MSLYLPEHIYQQVTLLNLFIIKFLVVDMNGLEIIGVFHSHPNHPAKPSEYDRELALPWWSYLIISIQQKRVDHSRSWVLSENRDHFIEESLKIESQ